MTSSLTELRPPPTLPTQPPAPIRQQPSTIGYWIAAIVAVLGLTAALVWGAVGTSNALDQVDTFDRVAVPGQVAVSVTDPGTLVAYYEGPAVQARSADPTANHLPDRAPLEPGHRRHHQGHLRRHHPDLAAARAASDRPRRSAGAGQHRPLHHSLRPEPRPDRPGGGQVRSGHGRAVPGGGDQGRRG